MYCCAVHVHPLDLSPASRANDFVYHAACVGIRHLGPSFGTPEHSVRFALREVKYHSTLSTAWHHCRIHSHYWKGDNHEEVWRRVFQNVLVGPGWMRQCGIGHNISQRRHRATCVALAFGLTVLTMAFALGHVSGCHLNPAVSVGFWAGGRFPAKELLPYIVSQVLGGIVAGGVLYIIATGKPGFAVSAGFAANGYETHSPGGYSLWAALVTEVVMTMMFLLIIMGATDKRAPQGFVPIAIGLGLTWIHLISIPVTNTPVNPARSTGVALFVGDWAIAQLWLFWLAPVVGGFLGAKLYRFIGGSET